MAEIVAVVVLVAVLCRHLGHFCANVWLPEPVSTLLLLLLPLRDSVISIWTGFSFRLNYLANHQLSFNSVVDCRLVLEQRLWFLWGERVEKRMVELIKHIVNQYLNRNLILDFVD